MSKARLQEAEIGEGQIFAFIREGYWNSLENFCQEYYKKTSDPLYVFWKAYAQHQNGNSTGAINDLLSIQTKKEVSYSCIVALMFYQSQARNMDKVRNYLLRNSSTPFELDKDNNEEMAQIKPSFKPFTFTASSGN